MRIAFLADIHGNLQALQACLAAARASGVDRYVFLGDIVGYGADPAACVDIVAEHCAKGALALKGNHDEAVERTSFRLNDIAGVAIDWTRAVLSPDQRSFLAALPLTITDDERLYVHASANAPQAYNYIHGLREAADSLAATEARLTVVGHVHDPALYHISVTGKVMGFIPMQNNAIPLLPQRRWLAVMGAVGQPRDGNPAAAFGTLDVAKREITYVRVPYDVEAAAARIRAAGLPDRLWQRLSLGR